MLDGFSFDLFGGSGKIENRGLVERFCIVRVKDGQTMATNIETLELAQQRLHSDLVPRAQQRRFN